jgi:putative membrane protein
MTRKTVAGGRAALSLCGAGVVVAAQLAPLDDRFWTHMLQHLLIGDAGPLLLVAARPLRVRWAPALAVWSAALVGWHLTPLYDAALRHPALHLLQHASFLAAGACLWSVVLGSRLSTARKLPFVAAAWAVSLALSQVLLWSGHSYYRGYTLGDQRAGGGVMLVEGSFVMVGVLVWLLLRLFAETEARQRVLDGYPPPA